MAEPPEQADTKDDPVKDDPVNDLLDIISASQAGSYVAYKPIVALNKDILMEKLCTYIVSRDTRVYNHGYEIGKKANDQIPTE